MKKFFSGRSGENVYGKILSSKSAVFYLRKIKKLPAKWQEMIENNGKYTIHWSYLIVKLFVNKSYSTKMKIIDDST